ncbi:acetyl-coenzyme A transporter 1-like isoform X2 [Daktulosphaira vitifoliae]|uniref:acetyl-coenzyme A transporter 1-like isoform X2 n=1 Tax=Daktulosphaira vitifoliae TaxID=58002 RepID=UPI0021A9D78C|nr:acetyl-coenzyme A transporter 1-like isoform X2 [Daktulosphaira vitifoliae]
MAKYSQPDDCENSDTSLQNKPNLKGDWKNIYLLILLYTLQGVPVGFLSAMPIILKNHRNTTYEDQAVFSIANWPFSMKLIWAPIVDSLYIKKFGRRKSWLIPVQLLLGAILLLTAFNINNWMYEKEKPQIDILTVIFFIVNILAATQDVAVDGWALTLLKKENVGYASTCNSSGQSLGSFLGFVVTILLSSENFCNNYLRTTPIKGGIVSLKNFLYFWGVIFILLTTLIGFLKKEVSNSTIEQNTKKLNVGFAASNNVATLKLLDGGLSTDDLMIVTLALYPAKILVPIIVSKYTSGPKPISTLLNVYPYRLSCSLLSAILVYLTPKFIMTDNGTKTTPLIYYVFLGITMFVKEILIYCIFVAFMAFFSKISDPRFGGTYMTLLNTVTNLGSSWTTTASLSMVDWLTFKNCSNDLKNNCSTEDLIKACKTCGGSCSIKIDGFYIEVMVCLVLGIIWYVFYNKKLRNLQTKGHNYWSVTTEDFQLDNF